MIGAQSYALLGQRRGAIPPAPQAKTGRTSHGAAR